jgi:hypothetical protein
MASTRSSAVALLLLAWVLAVCATHIGQSGNHSGAATITAFLLWRIWRGGAWSQVLLTTMSLIAAVVGTAMIIGLALGAQGLVSPTLWASLLFAGMGIVINAPTVRQRASVTPFS